MAVRQEQRGGEEDVRRKYTTGRGQCNVGSCTRMDFDRQFFGCPCATTTGCDVSHFVSEAAADQHSSSGGTCERAAHMPEANCRSGWLTFAPANPSDAR